MMSGPELPYKISSSKKILACLEKIIKGVDDLRLHLNKARLHDNKAHYQLQTIIRNFKLQMQPQAEPVSDFSILTKTTSRNILASSDLATDLSSGLDYGVAVAPGFRGPSNHDPHISLLRTQTRSFTPLSCDLEPDITKPTPRNIVASSDLATDPSADFNSGVAIAQGFCGPSNHQRDQTMLRNSKLQIQPQAVPVSHFSI